jgi:hypothetical protein
MGNIVEYVQTNLKSFEEHPFSAVDSLVLSQFCYLDFGDAVPGPGSGARAVALKTLFRAERFGQMFSRVWDEENCRLMLAAMAASPRFRDIGLNFYVNRFDPKLEKQFSAVTFFVGGAFAYSAFRGTDTSVIGWKEDFNMTYLSPIPSQIDAADYFRDVAVRTGKMPLRLGGHSKGGNLAVYAAANCRDRIFSRIEKVYNHDGPGFHADVTGSEGYKNLKGRIDKTMPASSVIGMMLESEVDYRAVQSHRFGILQHDPFSWKVARGDFVDAQRMSPATLRAGRAMRSWLDRLPDEERERFVDALFDVIMASGAETFYDITDDWQNEAGALIRAIKDLNPQTSKFLRRMLRTLAGETILAVGSVELPKLPDFGELTGHRRDKSDKKREQLK